MEYRTETTINAPAETVWSILMDGASFPEWDPGTIRIEGTIADGEKITAYSQLSPDRAFPVTVTMVEPGRQMTWHSGMPLGLFKGVRTFTLTPQEGGTTHFSMREKFSGIMLPIIGRTIPNMTDTFNTFAQGLKARAEG